MKFKVAIILAAFSIAGVSAHAQVTPLEKAAIVKRDKEQIAADKAAIKADTDQIKAARASNKQDTLAEYRKKSTTDLASLKRDAKQLESDLKLTTK